MVVNFHLHVSLDFWSFQQTAKLRLFLSLKLHHDCWYDVIYWKLLLQLFWLDRINALDFLHDFILCRSMSCDCMQIGSENSLTGA